MDSLYNSKLQKLHSLSANVSPINTPLYNDSTLLRYLRSASPLVSPTDTFSSPASSGKRRYSGSTSSTNTGSSFRSPSPLASLENFERTSRIVSPTSVEDEVLVMDGILVGSVPAGKASRSVSSLSTDSGGGSASTASPGKILRKSEVCRVWMEFGHCRYGYGCHFAHGMEELRPSHLPIKNKPELRRSYTGVGSLQYGLKSRFVDSAGLEGTVAIELPCRSVSSILKTEQLSSPSLTPKPEQLSRSPILVPNTEHLNRSPDSSSTFFRPVESDILTRKDNWSPLDDGIDIPLSREEFDAYIDHVLHGPTARKRFPVFTKLTAG